MMIAEQDMYYVWHDYIERAEDFPHSPIGKKTYALRSQTIERVFADAKEKHAMRYTPYRGLPAVTAWVKLKFAAMNLKKLAIHKWMRLLFPPFYRIRSRIARSQCGFFDKLAPRFHRNAARSIARQSRIPLIVGRTMAGARWYSERISVQQPVLALVSKPSMISST